MHICLYIYTSRKPWGVAGGLQSLAVHQRIPAEGKSDVNDNGVTEDLRQDDESDGDIEKSVNEQKSVNKGWPVPAEVEHLESDMFHVATYPDSYDSPRTYVMENAGNANA